MTVLHAPRRISEALSNQNVNHACHIKRHIHTRTMWVEDFEAQRTLLWSIVSQQAPGPICLHSGGGSCRHIFNHSQALRTEVITRWGFTLSRTRADVGDSVTAQIPIVSVSPSNCVRVTVSPSRLGQFQAATCSTVECLCRAAGL